MRPAGARPAGLLRQVMRALLAAALGVFAHGPSDKPLEVVVQIRAEIVAVDTLDVHTLPDGEGGQLVFAIARSGHPEPRTVEMAAHVRAEGRPLIVAAWGGEIRVDAEEEKGRRVELARAM